MTSNQIAYWNLQENQRANLERERNNRNTLAETNRSNLINEGIKRDTLNETQRSNLINEGIKDKDVNSQIKRRKVQNGTDIANAVTSGIKNVLTGGASFAKLFK